jgi:hypothetical protein
MMRLELPGRTTQALIASIALLSLFIVVHLLYPAAPSNAATGALPDDEAALPEFGNEALVPPALANLGDMLERPLFFTDRRIPEPPKDETPPPPPKPLRLQLQGIALAGGSRVAVLRNLSNNLLLQLAEGETHDGWTLDQVNSNSATFSRGEETTELPLDPDTSSGRR